ncbi:MAG: hypothetical protein V1773_11295 [bacterium]
MKKVLLIVFLLVSAGFANAKVPNYFVEKGIPNIVKGMESDVTGLVESCIYQSILLKNKYPELNFNNVVTTLKDLSINGATVKIRYQAHLAFLYIKNISLFNDLNFLLNSEPEDNFRSISGTIERLASN